MSSLDFNRAIIVSIGDAQAAAADGKWSLAIEYLQHLPPNQLDERVLDIALQILIQGDFEQQWEIAKIIPKLGEIAIQPLLEIANDTDLDLEDRWFGTRILGDFSQPQVITALIDLIQRNEDPELTTIATGALTRIGMPAISALTDLLATPDRQIAVTILAQIRHSKTIEPLIQILDDPDPQLRTLATEALGSFHDPRIPPLLITKLTDLKASVRQAAIVGLCLRGDLAVELNLLQHLRPLLFDLDLAVCQAAALGLARLTDLDVVSVLTEVLTSVHTPTDLKSSIIIALGWIGTRSAIDSLVMALNIATDLAPAIVASISKTERERVYASQMLIVYLHSHQDTLTPHPAIVKQEIAVALGNLGNSSSVPYLVKFIGDPDDRVKLYTITAIFKLSPTIPTEILQLAERSDLPPSLQVGIQMCLSHWDRSKSL
jgi:HEAT repeat protein